MKSDFIVSTGEESVQLYKAEHEGRDLPLKEICTKECMEAAVADFSYTLVPLLLCGSKSQKQLKPQPGY